MALMISTYLETTASFPSELFSNACNNLSRRGSPYAPSAGEIYEECSRLAAIEFQNRAPTVPRLPKPDYPAEHRAAMVERLTRASADIKSGRWLPPDQMKHGYTAAQLADFSLILNIPRHPEYVMRTDSDGVPLVIPAHLPGGGKKVCYGYLTPMEAQQPPHRGIVNRTVPGSFMARWERENGREYAPVAKPGTPYWEAAE
jgi:hypothetical protein